MKIKTKIKTKLKKLIQKIKNNKLKSTAVFLVLIFVFNLFGNGNGEEVYITETPTIESLEQIVSVSGTVEADQKIDLRFQSSGKVENINFNIGDEIKEYELISELDNDLQQNSVNSALAQLNIANADLNLAYAGPTEAEAQLSLIRIEEAELNYNNAKNNYEKVLANNAETLKVSELQYQNALEAFENSGYQLENTDDSVENNLEIANKALEDAYDAADEVVKNTILSLDDSLININDNDDIKDKILSSLINFTQIYKESTGKDLDIVEDVNFFLNLSFIEADFNSIKISYTVLQQELTQEEQLDVLNNLKQLITDLLFNINLVNESLANLNEDESSLSTDLQAYKTILETEITNLNTISSTLDLSIQTIEDASLALETNELSNTSTDQTSDLDYITKKNNLDIASSNLETVKNQNEINDNNAKLELDLKEVYLKQAETTYQQLVATPRAVDVASLKSRVSQYNSSYERALIQLEDTKLYSPTNGVITDISIDVGENISSAENVVTIINDQLQILANISETEIAKVNIGDSVRLTLDALSYDKEYTAKVIKIDPAETVIQGVIYYQTTILFDDYEPAIKPGMTVNLDIITESIDEALQIPIQALNYEDSKIYVYILEGDEKVRQYVETGVEGDYNVEILEGLSLSDDVIIYEKT